MPDRPAVRDRPAVHVKRRRSAARRCESGPAMRDHPAVQVKRQHSAAHQGSQCCSTLSRCQHFVNTNVLSVSIFCRRQYFVCVLILRIIIY
jgi:hypothetical protein